MFYLQKCFKGVERWNDCARLQKMNQRLKVTVFFAQDSMIVRGSRLFPQNQENLIFNWVRRAVCV